MTSNGKKPTRKSKSAQPRVRNYREEEQRRLDRLLAEGWASRAQRDQALKQGRYAPGKVRDHAAERARRVQLAKAQGFTGLSQKQAYRKTGNDPRVATQKQLMLAKFNVSATEFERMRRANLDYVRPPVENWNSKSGDKRKALSLVLRINEYDVDIDLDPNDWSERRVGYVTSFYRAIIAPKTNYLDSLLDDGGSRIINPRTKKPKTNRQQWDYLVKYTEIMQIDEFERRYGASYA